MTSRKQVVSWAREQADELQSAMRFEPPKAGGGGGGAPKRTSAARGVHCPPEPHPVRTRVRRGKAPTLGPVRPINNTRHTGNNPGIAHLEETNRK